MTDAPGLPPVTPAAADVIPPASDRPQAGGWTAGRITAVVVASLAAVVAAALVLAGVILAVASGTMRDQAGFLMTGQQRLATPSYALTSRVTGMPGLDTAWDMPMMSRRWTPSTMMGRVRIDVEATGKPVFVGLARPADAAAYLHGVRHATLLHLGDRPGYRTSGSRAPAAIPSTQHFWVGQESGTGRLSLAWPRRAGAWTVVVMNADASRGVSVLARAGATVPALAWAGAASLTVGGVGLAATVLLLVLVLRSAGRRPRER